MFFKQKKVETPKYFETIGDTISQNKLLKIFIVLISTIAILELVVIHSLMNKPPLVIKVNEVGNTYASVQDFKSTLPSKHEVSNFIHYFEEYFVANDIYTYKTYFKKAFSMMTENAEKQCYRYILDKNIEAFIEREQIKTALSIANIEILSDTGELLTLSVKGNKQITSYENKNFYKEIIFEHVLILKRIPRTEKEPWGLLIEAWEEKLFKQ
jgi:hypothetical protein